MRNETPNRSRFALPLALAAAALAAPPAAAAPPAPEATPAVAPPVSGTRAGEAGGFLYGTVTTRSGATYRGRLRWGTEEAFWDDHFNANKAERPFADDVPRRYRSRMRESIRIFGVDVGLGWHSGASSRQLVARFGDIKKIEVEDGDDAMLVMKGGARVPVHGGSNDLGARIGVQDETAGSVDIPWKKIRTIEFQAAPAAFAAPVFRLRAKVTTRDGEFQGFLQWDKEESLSTDKLDGETDDGKVALEMGKIRSIERQSRRSSRVTLRDGREMVLSGTNDVDDDNRGVVVEDPRYGRVTIPWSSFERAELLEPGPSGPGYDDYPAAKPLRGSVTRRDGTVLKGRIVFDVDESETWETLDGERRRISYAIPFARVAAVVPDGDRSRLKLRSGEEIVLSDSTDVSDGNAGVLVYEGEKGAPRYVPWDDVSRLDFVE